MCCTIVFVQVCAHACARVLLCVFYLFVSVCVCVHVCALCEWAGVWAGVCAHACVCVLWCVVGLISPPGLSPHIAQTAFRPPPPTRCPPVPTVQTAPHMPRAVGWRSLLLGGLLWGVPAATGGPHAPVQCARPARPFPGSRVNVRLPFSAEPGVPPPSPGCLKQSFRGLLHLPEFIWQLCI